MNISIAYTFLVFSVMYMDVVVAFVMFIVPVGQFPMTLTVTRPFNSLDRHSPVLATLACSLFLSSKQKALKDDCYILKAGV